MKINLYNLKKIVFLNKTVKSSLLLLSLDIKAENTYMYCHYMYLQVYLFVDYSSNLSEWSDTEIE